MSDHTKCSSCPRARNGSCPSAAWRAHPPIEPLERRVMLAVNPIVAENQLPGTPPSVWDVPANNVNPGIEGFATSISVDQGDRVDFKVNTNATDYRFDIYRIGYYGGLGARAVASVEPTIALPQAQPAPLTDPATGLVDAGNWGVSGSWQVPEEATSGVYIAKLVREDGIAGSNHIIFIVRDDDGGSDVLFQTSDSTWHAYNNWGGKSVYDHQSEGGRAFKVSYNRPFNTRTGTPEGRDYFFGAEYPMVRWLEANGYDVSYTTGVDTHRDGEELLEHQLFLSVGHDEYWSGPQRDNVEAARDAGVNLAFFSGNEMYWKTRWEPSIDGSGTADRTLVVYKETHAQAKIDPEPGVWTGQWRDPRFGPHDGGRPENALTGQLFSVNRGENEVGTSIQVPSEFADMRLWRNTSVANLADGAVAVLGDRVLGYEWDEDVDNTRRPAGLFTMSSTTEFVQQKLLDDYSGFGPEPCGCGTAGEAGCGCVVAPGWATHSLTMYRDDSGALVFGAGTVQWSWGLDGTHDGGPTTPDPRMRQATVNLFADMNVQPATLQGGLVLASMSNDLTAPAITLTSPGGGSTRVVGEATLITGTASDVGGGVVGGVEVSVDGGRSWRRATGRGEWSYSWTPAQPGAIDLLARAVDDSGNLSTPTAPVTVQVQQPPPNFAGLVAAYAFDELSGGQTSDAGGFGLDALVSGATLAPGIFGNALAFDGIDDWLTIADHDALDLTNGMTIEAWVRPQSFDEYNTVVLKERGTEGLAWSLYAADSGGAGLAPSAIIRTTRDHIARDDGNPLPLNAWSHLATTYDGNLLRLYINGQLVDERSVGGSIATSSSPLRIGGNAVWGEYFHGLIDEVRIYDLALSSGQLASNLSAAYTGGADITPPATALISTAPDATVQGNVVLQASATDDLLIAGVQFLVNGQPVGSELTSPPYEFTWNTLQLPNGNYNLSVRARDFAGNATTTPATPVLVSNANDVTLPQIAIRAPWEGDRIGGTILLSAVASDDRAAIEHVQFLVDGQLVGTPLTGAPYRMLWDASGLSDGVHTIAAIARDAAGNVQTSTTIQVVADAADPVVTAQSPAAGTTSGSIFAPVTATFSEPILFETLAFTLRDPNGNVVPGSATYNSTTWVATFTPSSALSPDTTYSATVVAADTAGNVSDPTTWSFTTAADASTASLWNDSILPAVASADDANPYELGVRFRASTDGFVTAIRFYKGPLNTGTHVGHLWSADGTLLAEVTFTNETSQGWQQAHFATPVAIVAGQTYVASYHAPTGGYAIDAGYFATAAHTNGPLTALASSDQEGNGVYRAGADFGFPSNTFNASNYWVDVVFSGTLAEDTTPPSVASTSPQSGATNASPLAIITASFNEAVVDGSFTFELRDANGNVVPASVTYNATTRTAQLTPATALLAGNLYTATIANARDLSDNVMPAPHTWSFTVAENVGAGLSLWENAVTPAVTSVQDFQAVELGVRFQASVDGFATGVRFFRGPQNTGPHIGRLWTSAGVLLAEATFAAAGEGWQEVTFAEPVPLTAGTIYVASYFAPNGGYAADAAYFAAGSYTNGPLTALGNGNGLYRYGGGFPTETFDNTNYWVDVSFAGELADTTPPAITARTPASDAVEIPADTRITVTFDEPLDPASVNTATFVLTDAAGTAILASTTYDAATRTATLTPDAPLAGLATYTVTLTGLADLSGNAVPTTSWSFAVENTIVAATVVGRHVFYNNSFFDTDHSILNPGATDDDAIDPTKQALLPGQTATYANYTNYDKGLNGLMIDVSGLANPSALSAADFEFATGNGTYPSTTWTESGTLPTPVSVAVRPGAGVGGSDRVVITFADHSIKNTWLRVTVKATAVTGLASPDLFYFGNAVGDANVGNGTSVVIVNAVDELAARNNFEGDPFTFNVSSLFDFNRDGNVNAIDELIARNNNTNPFTGLVLIGA